MRERWDRENRGRIGREKAERGKKSMGREPRLELRREKENRGRKGREKEELQRKRVKRAWEESRDCS